MAQGKTSKCEHCGANKREYSYTLNRSLGWTLVFVIEKGGVVDFKTTNFPFNVKANFAKLRHWGLIEWMDGTDKKSGRWSITALGRDFVANIAPVRKTIWTYRAELVRFDGPMVYFRDLRIAKERTREDYARDSRPHVDKDGQAKLL